MAELSEDCIVIIATVTRTDDGKYIAAGVNVSYVIC